MAIRKAIKDKGDEIIHDRLKKGIDSAKKTIDAIFEKTQKKTVDIVSEAINILKLTKFESRTIKNERDLELQAMGCLEYGFKVLSEKIGVEIPVQEQSISLYAGKMEIPDIIIGDNEVVIELKYIRGRDDINKAKAQAVSYSNLPGVKGVVFLLFDLKDKVREKDKIDLLSIKKVKEVIIKP